MLAALKSMARHWVMAFIHPRPLIGLFFLPRYFSHWLRFKQLKGAPKLRIADLQPCLGDWTAHTPFDPHYFYQGAWLARRLQEAEINKHVDVGSSVLTVSVLSAYVETIFVDYRPLKASLPGLTAIAGTILNLPFADNSLPSLSCLHVIEHIGLGRYGDTLDPLGSVKAAIELQRVLRVGGSLFLSLPIGRERICFNAHRVHSAKSTVKLFPQMSLIEFSYVDDAGQFLERKSVDENINFEYGCGLFHLQKI